jgi:HEAT repeat protein
MLKSALNQEQQKKLEILHNGTSDQKIELMNEFSFGEFDEIFVEDVARLITDEDKGVRNTVTMFILANQNSKFPFYIVPFVSAQDISIRNLAGEILIKLGSLSVDAIIQFDHQNNDDDIKFVIDVLGLIGDDRAAPFTMEILSESENDNVILACIEALGNLHYQGAVDILILFYDRSELYKPTIVESLGKIGSKSAANFLIEKFKIEDELTQYSILESLGNLGDLETFFFLLEQVNNVSGPLILPLVVSISTLKERYNVDIPFDNRMKSLLMYTITEGTLDHKRVAFNLIESFDDKDILLTSLSLVGADYELDEMIKSKLFRNAEYFFKEITRIISSSLKNLRQVLNLFLQTINYVNDFQTPINLSMLEIRGISQTISGLLSHPDEEVRRASMELLFNLDPETAILFIDSMVTDENVWNRMRLVEILERYPGEEVEQAIHKLAQDEDEMVKDRAQFVLDIKVNNFPSNMN